MVIYLWPHFVSQGGVFGGDPRDISELFASVIHDMGSALGKGDVHGGLEGDVKGDFYSD